MNLHNIVAGAIGSINPHETVKVYRSAGTQNVKGKVIAVYEVSERRAQIQAPTESDIKLVEKLAEASHKIKVWIESPIGTINRVSQSVGDMIERDDGTYWLVVGVADDFSRVGWCCCLCVLQTKAPEMIKASVIIPIGGGDDGT